MSILAGSPGDKEITETFKGWLVEIDKQLEVELAGNGYTDAENYPKQQRISNKLIEEYLKIYDKLIALLNDKKLLDFETGAKPKFEKKGHLSIPT